MFLIDTMVRSELRLRQLDQLLRLYGDRVLPLDAGVARRWGADVQPMGRAVRFLTTPVPAATPPG